MRRAPCCRSSDLRGFRGHEGASPAIRARAAGPAPLGYSTRIMCGIVAHFGPGRTSILLEGFAAWYRGDTLGARCSNRENW